MTSYGISALASALEGNILYQWRFSRANIELARDDVDAYIDSGGHAYGFSTFLGHLDRHAIGEAESRELLRAHLVGVPSNVPPEIIRGITVIKLCQLTHGRNGISPMAYNRLLESFGTEVDSLMDLDASYGSGDVVCAAWWSEAVFGPEFGYSRGDVISLINGHFVVPGLMLSIRGYLYGLFGRAGDVLAEVVARIPAVDNVQRPVSVRDLKPLISRLESSLAEYDKSIVLEANRPSGNPLFYETNRGLRPTSNSSFLSFEISGAVSQMCDSVRILSTYLRSMTLALGRVLETSDRAALRGAYFVQFPKVSKAYLDQIQSSLVDSVNYSQSESVGIEDVGDGALIRFRRLQGALPLLEKQISLLEELVRRGDTGGPESRE